MQSAVAMVDWRRWRRSTEAISIACWVDAGEEVGEDAEGIVGEAVDAGEEDRW